MARGSPSRWRQGYINPLGAGTGPRVYCRVRCRASRLAAPSDGGRPRRQAAAEEASPLARLQELRAGPLAGRRMLAPTPARVRQPGLRRGRARADRVHARRLAADHHQAARALRSSPAPRSAATAPTIRSPSARSRASRAQRAGRGRGRRAARRRRAAVARGGRGRGRRRAPQRRVAAPPPLPARAAARQRPQPRSRTPGAATVWQIGGGWGGFAYQFKRVVSRRPPS